MKLIRHIAAILGLAAATSGAPAGAKDAPLEQAVIVHFKYGSTDLSPLFELEDRLESVISKAKVGEYDGHEIAVDGSDGRLYMYGPNADRLFEVVKPVLEAATFMKGAKVVKRYGPPGKDSREVSIVLKV
ncbi:MAG: hypothetical protein ACXU8N_21400 [Telluria sp.]